MGFSTRGMVAEKRRPRRYVTGGGASRAEGRSGYFTSDSLMPIVTKKIKSPMPRTISGIIIGIMRKAL